ncbi:MAG: hypothetical protein PVI09_19125, partial [Anaerolineae bacterium]
ILGLALTLSSSYTVTPVQAERARAPGPEVTPRQGSVPVGARQTGNFITNGSFETGDFTGWNTGGNPWVGTTLAYDGTYSARLGAANNRDDIFYQEVTLPSDPQWIYLSYYVYMYSEEFLPDTYDYFYVEAQDTNGTLLAILHTLDNTYPREQWLVYTINLADYPQLLGQTVRIVFQGITDSSYFTSFYIDQVELYQGVNVLVQDEGGHALEGAKVYHNNTFVGQTGSDGGIAVPGVQVGDRLSALHEVYQHPSKKDYHDLGGTGGSDDWAWRAYQTNVRIDTTSGGTPQLHTVTDTSQTQVLTVRRDQALLGMHMVVSVEWDASSTYLEDLGQGLQSASTFLYDVTDGQVFWEVIEIFDNRERWADCDMCIHASNQVWPNSTVWGIPYGSGKRISMGRFFDGNTSNRGLWKYSDGYRTMIHEFGHYGFGLWDEYLDRDSKKVPIAYCATNFDIKANAVAQESQSSIMYYQFSSTELCSDVDPNHRHRIQTEQDAKTGGMSTWELVLLRYEDKDSPARWTLLSPVERGTIVPGPDAIPVRGWSQIYGTDASTSGLCAPFTQKVFYAGSGQPVEKAELWLDRPGTLPDIKQGRTDKAGEIVIYGAHNGDTLRARKDGASASATLSCSSRSAAQQSVAVEPDPFGLEVSVTPVNTYTVNVQLASTTTLADEPLVELWQDGADAPVGLTMVYDTDLEQYVGQAILDTTRKSAGYVTVEATDSSAQTVNTRTSFDIKHVPAGELTRLFPGETFEIVFPADSLNADAAVAVQRTSAGGPAPNGLVQVSDAYQVFVSTGQYDFSPGVTIHMRYHAEQAASAQVRTVQIYRWDEGTGQWIPYGSTVDEAFNLISADDIGQLSIFAAFGQPAAENSIYLPLVLRSP